MNCFIDGINTFYRGSEDWFVGYPANSPPTRFNWTDFFDPKYRIGLLSDKILSFESVGLLESTDHTTLSLVLTWDWTKIELPSRAKTRVVFRR